VSNIGSKPTFRDSGEVSIETHVLDFDADLYDKQLELHFLYRIRDEKKFGSPDELVLEIKKDIDFAIKRGFSTI
jgi:riboflavin kinase/FMN adenylyltransferase